MRAIISGATRGIGKAISLELAKRNFDLFLIARNLSDLEKCKKDLQNPSIDIQIAAADLSDEESITSLKGKIEQLTKVDLLVNNLGQYETNSPSEIRRKELQQLLDVNLFSAIELTGMVLPFFEAAYQGSIINIGSIMSVKSAPFAANYSISKHAFKGWNDALRDEVRDRGIKVSAIYPGAVNTSSWDGIEVDRTAMIQAEDIAKLAGSICDLSENTLLDEIHLSPLRF